MPSEPTALFLTSPLALTNSWVVAGQGARDHGLAALISMHGSSLCPVKALESLNFYPSFTLYSVSPDFLF